MSDHPPPRGLTSRRRRRCGRQRKGLSGFSSLAGFLLPRAPGERGTARDARDLCGWGWVCPAKVRRLRQALRQQHRAARQLLVSVLRGATSLGVLVHSGPGEVLRRRTRRGRARCGVQGTGARAVRGHPGLGRGHGELAAAESATGSRAAAGAHRRSRHGSGPLPSRSQAQGRAGLVERGPMSSLRDHGAEHAYAAGEAAPATTTRVKWRIRAPAPSLSRVAVTSREAATLGAVGTSVAMSRRLADAGDVYLAVALLVIGARVSTARRKAGAPCHGLGAAIRARHGRCCGWGSRLAFRAAVGTGVAMSRLLADAGGVHSAVALLVTDARVSTARREAGAPRQGLDAAIRARHGHGCG